MGISFSSSLFGLAGSLMLGFLDLQSSQAQNRFYTDLEDWLASTVREYAGDGAHRGRRRRRRTASAIERLRDRGRRGRRQPQRPRRRWPTSPKPSRAWSHHMRTEQQMIREWADGQGEQNREIKKLLERLARQRKELTEI